MTRDARFTLNILKQSEILLYLPGRDLADSKILLIPRDITLLMQRSGTVR